MDLYLFNSLTNESQKFDHDKSKPIKWYTCGPTIYDFPHLGHARTFISFDVIRRVLIYLGYDIIYVMNITDIDDKIINKVKSLNTSNTLNTEMDENIYMKFIFEMETEFLNNMDQLNIIRPTVMTRVTEYIEKIKEYIEKMEQVGLTYCSNGTVYIDSEKYLKKGYKWDMFGRSIISEYTDCDFSVEKKNNADFALWKAAKSGEIKFYSKWGYGRPAWHIECSTMSNDILGDTIDIHSGGIDLIYPHHNNEIIQSMVYNENDIVPIKYFLHCGHLNINGAKMSKSLGNFITINKFLNMEKCQNPARLLRLLFLIHSWHKPMDFTEDILNEAILVEKRIMDFYANMNHILRIGKKIITKYTQNDQEYLEYTIKMKQSIESSLLQNVDTKNVVHIILHAISTTYKYTECDYNITLVNNLIEHITYIFNVFGLNFVTNANINVEKNVDKFIDIIVDLREDVRSTIKKNMRDIPKNVSSELFKILDNVRDNELQQCGIVIEDLGKDKKNKWKYIQVKS